MPLKYFHRKERNKMLSVYPDKARCCICKKGGLIAHYEVLNYDEWKVHPICTVCQESNDKLYVDPMNPKEVKEENGKHFLLPLKIELKPWS